MVFMLDVDMQAKNKNECICSVVYCKIGQQVQGGHKKDGERQNESVC